MGIKKESIRTGPYKDFFAQGVKVGDALYLAGQIGIDANGKTGSDLTEQTKIAYENIRNVLVGFGATMENIVDETMFVTDMNETMVNLKSVIGAREEAFGGPPEVCQTLVQVGALAMPELKVEIKCIAHL